MKRLVVAIRYTFADAAGRLISNYDIRRIVAIVGTILMKTILKHTDSRGQDMYSPTKVLVHGLGMAWFKTIEQLVVPDGIWTGSVLFDVTTALSMAILFRSVDNLLPGTWLGSQSC